MTVAERDITPLERRNYPASMGPQLDSCGKREVPAALAGSMIGLQWGRNLTVAESRKREDIQNRLARLQWGRNLTVAERPCSIGYAKSSRCFNGAATGQLRKESDLGGTSAHQRASMGPQLDSCGKAPPPLGDGQHAGASMGPQLDSCGKVCPRCRDPRYPLLQWGRNLTVAESRVRAEHLAARRELQWGRNLTVAERGPASRRTDHGHQASMGPQLDSCGK